MMLQIQGLSRASKALLWFCATFSVVIAAEMIVINTGNANGELTDEDSAGDLDSLVVASNVTLPRAPALNVYDEIIERPVFSDTRRPPPAGEAPTASARRADQMSAQWKLTGVVMAGDDSYVHVEGKRDRRTVQLQQNALLDGWRLVEINADQIVLESANDTVTLELHEETAKAR